MIKTMVGQFEREEDAQQTLHALIANGFSDSDIVVDERKTVAHPVDYGSEGASSSGEAAGILAIYGSVIGGLGGLTAGVGFFGTPGIGLATPGGNLATMIGMAIAGAGIGAAGAAVLGLIFGLGIRLLNYYEDDIRRSGIRLELTTSDDLVERAASIMREHNVLEIS